METQDPKKGSPKIAISILTILLLVALGGAGWFYYLFFETSEELSETETQLQGEIEVRTEQISELEEQLAMAQEQSLELSLNLQDREAELDGIRDYLNELVEDVDILQALHRTDRELLQKYSSVYFLNEHYFPSGITLIDDYYVYEDNKEEYIHENVEVFLMDMIEGAERDGIDLRVISAFRSFDRQADLKHHYNVVYGEGTASEFSAPQGFSEHQLGTAVDFTTEELGFNFENFHQTDAYQWLEENAHRFGFILSYTEDNPFFQFEPWHWRFVGIELATDLFDSGTHFYDMPQRELDEYRPKLFNRP